MTRTKTLHLALNELITTKPYSCKFYKLSSGPSEHPIAFDKNDKCTFRFIKRHKCFVLISITYVDLLHDLPMVGYDQMLLDLIFVIN